MPRLVFINLPVADLSASTEFYKQLGFTQNSEFSDDNASCMVWSDTIYVMLLIHPFYETFINGKTIADPKTTSSGLYALSFDSKDDVDAFVNAAVTNGGSSFKMESHVPEDMMYGVEVLDPDGHQWEAVWMAPPYDHP